MQQHSATVIFSAVVRRGGWAETHQCSRPLSRSLQAWSHGATYVSDRYHWGFHLECIHVYTQDYKEDRCGLSVVDIKTLRFLERYVPQIYPEYHENRI